MDRHLLNLHAQSLNGSSASMAAFPLQLWLQGAFQMLWSVRGLTSLFGLGSIRLIWLYVLLCPAAFACSLHLA